MGRECGAHGPPAYLRPEDGHVGQGGRQSVVVRLEVARRILAIDQLLGRHEFVGAGARMGGWELAYGRTEQEHDYGMIWYGYGKFFRVCKVSSVQCPVSSVLLITP